MALDVGDVRQSSGERLTCLTQVSVPGSMGAFYTSIYICVCSSAYPSKLGVVTPVFHIGKLRLREGQWLLLRPPEKNDTN